mmetsp:Transcript_28715/g.52317  ORF Transcript_28715/g.52317 Transcript_28715/m.52317 type:complete len:365 (+) Transcript_28715:61-1155(+)
MDKVASATVPGFAMVAAAFERLQAVVDEQNVALKDLRHDHEKLRWEHEGFRKELAVLKAGLHGALGSGCPDPLGGIQAMSRAKSLNTGLTLNSKSAAGATDSSASLPTRTWATMLGLESPRTPGAECHGRGHNSWMTACSTAEATPDSHRRDSAAELRELMSRSSSSSMGGAAVELLKEYDAESRIPSNGRLSSSKPYQMPAVMAPAPALPAEIEVRQFLVAGDQGLKPRSHQEAPVQHVEGSGPLTTPRLSSSITTPRVLDIQSGSSPTVVAQATPRPSASTETMTRTMSDTPTAWYALTALGKGGDSSSQQSPGAVGRAGFDKKESSVPRGAANGMWELDWSSVAPGSGRSSSSAKQAAAAS